MDSPSQIEAKTPRSGVHIRLKSMFWFQLVLAPAFLGPIYYGMQEEQHASVGLYYVGMSAYLLAPMCYVAILVTWSGVPIDRKRHAVSAIMQRGAIWAVLFSLLAFGPLAIPSVIERLTRILELITDFIRFANLRVGPSGHLRMIFEEVLRLTLPAGFFAFFYALIGAATGGVIGLARDFSHRPAAKSDPSSLH